VNYYIYGSIIGALGIAILAYCMYKGTAQLRAVTAELDTVVARREFLERQDAASGRTRVTRTDDAGAAEREAIRKAKKGGRDGDNATGAMGVLALVAL
jgi:hypothetical protein